MTVPVRYEGESAADYQQRLQNFRESQRLQRQEQQRENREAARIARQQARRSPGQFLGSAHVAVAPGGSGPRFIDALVTIVVSIGLSLWTASRNHNTGADVEWAIFWMLLGGVMAVQARTGSELSYAGSGVAASSAAYLGLRVTGNIT